ncbi:MAG: flagellar export chaperone FliS [Limisphaerales bacterium]
MNSVNPWSRYRQVATQTASPGQLVLMLYDGALGFLERSLQGFEMEDPGEMNEAIGKHFEGAGDIGGVGPVFGHVGWG